MSTTRQRFEENCDKIGYSPDLEFDKTPKIFVGLGLEAGLPKIEKGEFLDDQDHRTRTCPCLLPNPFVALILIRAGRGRREEVLGMVSTLHAMNSNSDFE